MTSTTAPRLVGTIRPRWWRDGWGDVLLALGVVAIGFAAMPDIRATSYTDAVIFCLHGLVVLTVRRAPVAAACVDSALRVAAPVVGLGIDDFVVPPLVIAAVVGTLTRPRVAAAVSCGLGLSVAISVVMVRGPAVLASDAWIQLAAELFVATFLGVLARRERLALTAQLDRTRHARQYALVAAERVRAADVLQAAVGDGLAQVTAAARDLDRLTAHPDRHDDETTADREPVAAALRRVQAGAQATLATTRQVLDIVRSSAPAPDVTAPAVVVRTHRERSAIDFVVVGLAGVLAFGSSMLDGRLPSLAQWLVAYEVRIEPVPVPLFVVGMGTVFARRRYPVAALAVVTAAVVGTVWAGGSSPVFVVAALLVLVFSVASRTALRRALVAVVLALSAFLLGVIWSPAYLSSFPGPSVFQLTASTTVAVTVLAGMGVRVGRDRAAAAIEQQRAAAAESEVARLQERRSVARDVHDVLAHQLSGIAVQAGAAASLIARRPGLAAEAARSIADALREAEQAFPRLIDGIDDPPDRLDEDMLERLTAGLRGAGAPVTTVVTGTAPAAPDETDRAAARILREALTNVLRHAGPVATTVHVTHEPERIRLTVRDDGPGATRRHVDPGGHGLSGMRERAELVGGELCAGADTRGWTVSATLPRGRR